MNRPDSAPISAGEPLVEILEGMRPRLKRILRTYHIPGQDAEDLIQEALLEALRQWEAIRNVEAWLAGTLRVKCAQYWRRLRAEPVQAVDPSALADLCQSRPPAQELDAALLDLRNLTRGLGERHRTVLWLRFGLGLSTKEVAQRLGYCPASVRKLTCRSIARLHRWAISSPEGD